MGKGKKKDDKKAKSEAARASEEPPSSSTSQTAMEVDPSSPQRAPPPATSPEEVAEEKQEEESEGLGLGLGSRSKKNKPKKKKGGKPGPPTEPSTAEPVQKSGPPAPIQPPSGPSGSGPDIHPVGFACPPSGYAPPQAGFAPPGIPPPGLLPTGYPRQVAPAQDAFPLPVQTTGWQRPQTPQQYPPTAQQPRQHPPTAQPPRQVTPVAPAQSSGIWQQRQPAPQQYPPQQQPYPQPMATESLPPSRSSSAQAPQGVGRGRGQGPSQSRSVPMQIGSPMAQSPAPIQQKPALGPQARSGLRSEVVCRYRIPEKIPGRTVRAMAIKLLVNYLPMRFQAIKVHRYDVSFRPDRPKKLLKNAYNAVISKHFANEFIAYDQSKNCYSFRQLTLVPVDGRKDFTVEIPDSNNKLITFEVSFKMTGIVDLGKIKRHMEMGGSSLQSPNEEIQCVDVILRQGALDSYVKCGRQFFKRPNQPIDLTGGLEMWTGLFQSAIFTSHAFINVDVAHKGFPKALSVVQHLTESFRLKTDSPVEQQRSREVENFKNFMKRLRVVATLMVKGGPNETREFICNSLVDPPNKLFFTATKNNKEVKMSVLEYFQKEKNYRILYPNLNCAWVGPKEKNIYYPLELLTVSYGQPLNKQLNEMQLSNMVRQAATPPDVRKRKIEEVARSMKYSQNIFFKKFGLEISENFLEVDAKIIDAPTLQVGDRTVVPRRGVWQINKLQKPEALEAWGFVSLECEFNPGAFENIKNMLTDCGKQMGMRVNPPRMIEFNKRLTELRNILGRAVDDGLKFMMIVINGFSRDAYHRVKQVAEREVGIITQCVKDNTMSRRMNPQTMKNILLKLNSKMMGINQSIETRSMPRCMATGGLMVVGADVTHPSPDQSNIPSIAAVTASLDKACFNYNIELSIQTPKKEMIVDFENMMFDHLKIYIDRNKVLPKKIYVFRDGVSEGQFAEVMNCELSAIHRAYERWSRSQKPEILFLLVQKRHHTRFFLGNNNSANVEPGTCVDTHIVHPKELDFYLVSHQAIKGTARPTRYHAVCNDSNMPYDEVEQLTYYLCHLYARCTRAVSYPTPTYYAHLACLRARSLTYGQTFDNRELEKAPQRLRVLDRMLQTSRMFFV